MAAAVQPETAGDLRPDLDRRAYARAVRRVVVLLVAVGVTARVARFLLPAAVWGDEAMLGLNLVHRDYAGLTKYLDHAQVAPVLFLWAEKFAIGALGTSEYAVRLLPLLAGVGGLLLFWDFARRVLPPTAVAFAVGLLAVSEWPVWMSASLKPYSGDLFWAALLLSLAARWHRRPERVWPLAGLAAIVPVAVGASYPVVFVAGGVSLYLLAPAWRGGPVARLLFAGYNLALVGSFAATYLLVGQAQVDPAAGATSEYMRSFWRAGFPPDSVSRVPLWLLDRHTNRAFAYPLGDNGGKSALTALFCLGGVVWCWRNGSRPLLVLCLAPFALNLTAAALGKYPYTGCGRLSQHLAPAVCLLAGAGCAAAAGRVAPRRAARLALVRWGAGALTAFAVAALVVSGLAPDYEPTCRAARLLYRELDGACRPGDRVAVPADLSAQPPLHWYLDRLGGRVVRVRPGDPPPAAARVWVVTPIAGVPDDARHRQFLDSVRPPGYRVGHTTWYAVRPYRYRGFEMSWLSAGVTCLCPPGDAEPPVLNACP